MFIKDASNAAFDASDIAGPADVLVVGWRARRIAPGGRLNSIMIVDRRARARGVGGEFTRTCTKAKGPPSMNHTVHVADMGCEWKPHALGGSV